MQWVQWGAQRVWGLRVRRERQVQRGGQEPAAAWSASCAEQREPPDVQELREPAELWKQRGALWGAQEHQEQRDEGAQEQ